MLPSDLFVANYLFIVLFSGSQTSWGGLSRRKVEFATLQAPLRDTHTQHSSADVSQPDPAA